MQASIAGSSEKYIYRFLYKDFFRRVKVHEVYLPFIYIDGEAEVKICKIQQIAVSQMKNIFNYSSVFMHSWVRDLREIGNQLKSY